LIGTIAGNVALKFTEPPHSKARWIFRLRKQNVTNQTRNKENEEWQ
jgi:hypothetical protein